MASHIRQSVKRTAKLKNKNAKYTLKHTKKYGVRVVNKKQKKYSYVSKKIAKNGKYTYRYR